MLWRSQLLDLILYLSDLAESNESFIQLTGAYVFIVWIQDDFGGRILRLNKPLEQIHRHALHARFALKLDLSDRLVIIHESDVLLRV